MWLTLAVSPIFMASNPADPGSGTPARSRHNRFTFYPAGSGT